MKRRLNERGQVARIKRKARFEGFCGASKGISSEVSVAAA
jgi:hypothetical protein